MGNGTKVVSTAKIFTQVNSRKLVKRWMWPLMVSVSFKWKDDGTEAYTRDGAFKVGPNGQITTADALPLAAGLQIDPEVTNVFVSPTGEVSVETADGTQIIGQLELVRFPNSSGLKALEVICISRPKPVVLLKLVHRRKQFWGFAAGLFGDV